MEKEIEEIVLKNKKELEGIITVIIIKLLNKYLK